NPLEPHGTLAAWDAAGRLTLHDATQGIFGCRNRVAELLGVRPDDVHVVSPYVGGGFGSKGPTWSHVVLAAMAARVVKRPVKLALSRPQMFGPIGQRSHTRQTVAIGAKRNGTMTALRHVTLAQTSTFDEFMEPASTAARMLYAVPNVSTTHKLVRSDIGTGTYTVMTQIAADVLGIAPERIVFRLGVTDFPQTPVSGGSQTAASAGSAVHAASTALRDKLQRAARPGETLEALARRSAQSPIEARAE